MAEEEIEKKQPASDEDGCYECERCSKQLWEEEEACAHMKECSKWILAKRPKVGDHLIRYDGFRFGLPEQHAICVTEADFFSPAMVVHFDFKRGVVADDLGSFARTPPDPKIGRRGLPVLSDEAAPVYVVPHGTSERLAAVRTKNRAIRMLGKTGCHQIYNNCEHFASWAVLGERKCKQLWIVGGLAFAASGALHAGGYVIGGAWGFATAHGIFILCKWGCILYFGSDATEHYWESIQAMLGNKLANKRCALCGGRPKGSVVTFDSCGHVACVPCLKRYVDNGGLTICPCAKCWEPLPPDLLALCYDEGEVTPSTTSSAGGAAVTSSSAASTPVAVAAVQFSTRIVGKGVKSGKAEASAPGLLTAQEKEGKVEEHKAAAAGEGKVDVEEGSRECWPGRVVVVGEEVARDHTISVSGGRLEKDSAKETIRRGEKEEVARLLGQGRRQEV